MKSFPVLCLISLFASLASADQIIDYGRRTAARLGAVETIEINAWGVKEIRIINEENKTKVLNARVYTERGTYTLNQLERELQNQESVRAALDPRDYVYALELDIASSFRGSRGRYRVQAVVDTTARPRPRPPRRPPPPPRRSPPPVDRGPYTSYEAQVIENNIYNFAWSSNGLNLGLTESRNLARAWVQRGRVCGSIAQVDNMIGAYERAYDRYRWDSGFSRDHRRRALVEIRHMSPCTDMLYTN